MLHSVNDEVVEPIAPNNSIRPRELVALIERLLAAGYTFQTLKQAMSKPPPRRVVVLTFDDGFADNRENLLPILQRFGIPATLFATNRRGVTFLSDEDIRALASTGLIEFGGHSAHHIDLRQCSTDELVHELEANRLSLQQLSGQKVESFAYPSGFYNVRERDAVAKAGFHWAVTTKKKAHGEKDSLQLPRQIIPRELSPLKAYLLATRGRYRL